MGKVRHSSATDGDSVAAWVEPSEGVSVWCVCGTPGYHDNPSGQVGETRAPAWLLLGGLLEFSSGMPPNPQTPPVASGGDMGRGSWERGGVGATWCHSQIKTEQHTTYKKDQTGDPAIQNPSVVVVLLWEAQWQWRRVSMVCLRRRWSETTIWLWGVGVGVGQRLGGQTLHRHCEKLPQRLTHTCTHSHTHTRAHTHTELRFTWGSGGIFPLNSTWIHNTTRQQK